jgi:multidrug resistance efflux pump
MTWSNRLRLFIGFIVVVAIALGATLILSQRETEVASRAASIHAVSYSVGSDYAGTIVDQKVNNGDSVKKGQRLMTIQSASLLADLNSKTSVPTSTAYTTSPDGTLTLIATQPGVVSQVGAHTGGFVSAGSSLATIDREGSLYVLADFRLDPYDFSRIQKGALVDLSLPNQQRLTGTVSRISVSTTAAGQADASIEVRSTQLELGKYDGLIAPGTPISATLHLRDNGPLAGVKESFVALLKQMGL